MKTVVLTGATAGIGREAAIRLAASGHKLVLVGRNAQRGEELAVRLHGAHFVQGDLSTSAGVAQVAESITEALGTVDVLINNAGVMEPRRRLTDEGMELNFAVHHLAPYSLTKALLPLLRTDGRVVNVNSIGHARAMRGSGPVTLDFDDLQSERSYEATLAYSRAKLANLLFSYELQRRYPAMTVVALHPGMVRTDLGRSFPRLQVMAVTALAPSAAKGAEPLCVLATDPDVVKGGYYDRNTLTNSSPASYDTEAARRLWEITEQLRGPYPASTASQ
ncbi:SDR family NAD(P)-dependent oxidoreductase [Nonomuraea turcica]|uniref:SDR family NAD(P)-dependent oxidoreductase n=1 Tax=Nonomuraea sp. G32 TaxID=3067274 RepID=UPI00273CBAB8|nr:SDR family NAD(P)-dependent oxidoreductase [Nonomuraea sp. G32]MDP4511547.1 SDR family NAD(P)-dependent oxidoreductase [Nonomuraea sp. G32]